MPNVPFKVDITANDGAAVSIGGVPCGAVLCITADDTGGTWGGGTLTFKEDFGAGAITIAAYTADTTSVQTVQTGAGVLTYQFTGGTNPVISFQVCVQHAGESDHDARLS